MLLRHNSHENSLSTWTSFGVDSLLLPDNGFLGHLHSHEMELGIPSFAHSIHIFTHDGIESYTLDSFGRTTDRQERLNSHLFSNFASFLCTYLDLLRLLALLKQRISKAKVTLGSSSLSLGSNTESEIPTEPAQQVFVETLLLLLCLDP